MAQPPELAPATEPIAAQHVEPVKHRPVMEEPQEPNDPASVNESSSSAALESISLPLNDDFFAGDAGEEDQAVASAAKVTLFADDTAPPMPPTPPSKEVGAGEGVEPHTPLRVGEMNSRSLPSRNGAGRSYRQTSHRPQSSSRSQATYRSSTSSPTGRFHPDRVRRLNLRGADPHCNIDYYAPNGAPDNDRKMKEASFLSGQAFNESLRYYPRGESCNVDRDELAWTERETHDSEPTYSGRPTTRATVHSTESIESDVRMRLGIAAPEPDWRPTQLHTPWSNEGNKSVRQHMDAYRARREANGSGAAYSSRQAPPFSTPPRTPPRTPTSTPPRMPPTNGASAVVMAGKSGDRTATPESAAGKRAPRRSDFSILAKPKLPAVPFFPHDGQRAPAPGGRPQLPSRSRVSMIVNAFGQTEAREARLRETDRRRGEVAKRREALRKRTAELAKEVRL